MRLTTDDRTLDNPNAADVTAAVPSFDVGPDWSLTLEAGPVEVHAYGMPGGFHLFAHEDGSPPLRAAHTLTQGETLRVLHAVLEGDMRWRKDPVWSPAPGRWDLNNPTSGQMVLIVGGLAALPLLLGGVASLIAGSGFGLPRAINSVPAQVLFGFASLFFLMILAATLIKIGEHRRAARWKATRAVVLDARLEPQVYERSEGPAETIIAPRIIYEFRAGGRTYQGRRLNFSEKPQPMSADELERRFRVRAPITIHYDPADPSNNVIDRDLPKELARGCLAATAICWAIVFALMWLLTQGLGGVRSATLHVNPIFLAPLAICLLFTRLWWGDRVLRARAAAWPTTSGQVVASKVVRNGRTWKPLVRYRYTVGGHSYTGSQITLDVSQGASRSRAEKWTEPYPIGANVRVHYDPDKPGTSALEIASKLPHILLAIAFVFFLLTVLSIRFVA